MQCKDIPEEPILEFLAKHEEEWTTWFEEASCSKMPTVATVMPGVPAKLRLAKMATLVRRGLVRGCVCGCRGDFVITEAGRLHLEALRKAA